MKYFYILLIAFASAMELSSQELKLKDVFGLEQSTMKTQDLNQNASQAREEGIQEKANELADNPLGNEALILLDDRLGIGIEGTFLSGNKAHASAIVQLGPAITYEIFYRRAALSLSAMYNDTKIFRISSSFLFDLNLVRLGIGKSIEYKNAPGFNLATISTHAYASLVLESSEIYLKVGLQLDKPSPFYVTSRMNVIGYKYYF